VWQQTYKDNYNEADIFAVNLQSNFFIPVTFVYVPVQKKNKQTKKKGMRHRMSGLFNKWLKNKLK